MEKSETEIFRGVLLISVLFSAAIAASPRPPAPVPQHPPAAAAVPLFARLSTADKSVRSYTVPIQLEVSLHRFVFTFHMHLAGRVEYKAPNVATFTIDRVPKQYAHLFNDLGTPLTWPYVYRLAVRNVTMQRGKPTYALSGVPRGRSQVQVMTLKTAEVLSPVQAQWQLADGWNVESTISESKTGNYIFPSQEIADIAGHGYKIHTVMTYGTYVLDPKK